jgi:hypothetical protein
MNRPAAPRLIRATAMQADGGRTAKRTRPIRGAIGRGVGRSIVRRTLREFLRSIICQDRQNGAAEFTTLHLFIRRIQLRVDFFQPESPAYSLDELRHRDSASQSFC